MNYPRAIAPKKRTNKQGQVRWLARYVDQEAGKQIEKSAGTFDTKREALFSAQERCLELHNIRSNQLIETDITVGDFVEFYWLEQRKQEIEHWDCLTSFIKMIEVTGFNKKELGKLNRNLLQRFWLEVDQICAKKEYSQSFRSKLRANMNSLMDYAVSKAFIEENYNFNLRIRTERSKKSDRRNAKKDLFEKSKRIWTVDQVQKYLPLFKDLGRKTKSIESIMWWAFFNLGIFTGLRKGELAGLKFSDFDLENKTLTINRNAVVNDRLKAVELRDPKEMSFGTLHITNEVIEVVKALAMWHQVNGTYDNEFLFQMKQGGLIYPDYWSRMFKRVQIQAGIPEEEVLPSTHYMRHTHLSLLAYRGYSMAEIQRRARHSDPRTTAKYYVHILDEKDLEMADSFSELIKIEE